MSDMSVEAKAMLDELKAMKDAMATVTQATQAQPGGAFAGWQAVKPQAVNAQVEKVLVPVEVGVKTGNVTVYFQLPGEVAASPDVLLGTIETMINMGLPVKAWQPKGGSNSWKR